MTKTCKMLCFCSFTWRSLRTFQSRMYLTSAVYLNKFQSKHFLYLIGGKTCWYEREKEKVSLVWEAHFKDIDRNRRSQRKLSVFCPIIPSSRVFFFSYSTWFLVLILLQEFFFSIGISFLQGGKCQMSLRALLSFPSPSGTVRPQNVVWLVAAWRELPVQVIFCTPDLEGKMKNSHSFQLQLKLQTIFMFLWTKYLTFTKLAKQLCHNFSHSIK